MRRPRPILAALVAALAAGLALSAPGPAASAAETATDTATETPAAADRAHGLKGDYYLQSAPGAFDFAEHRATRVDASVDFDSLESRLEQTTGQSDDVSVRWTGRIEPEHSEPYTFSMIGDNGFRLWIDGQLLIDHWVDDWEQEQTAEPVTLEAGQQYDIKIEYFEHYGGSNLHLRWQSPSVPKEAVPNTALTLPDGFEYDGPDASAVLADGRTLKMDFAEPLATPPAGPPQEHLSAVIGGAEWPLQSLSLDPDDPSVLLVGLAEPVVGRGGEADIHYDGQGGLARADGTELGEFWASGTNESEHQLRTRWADDVSAGNPHPEYPRPQLTRKEWRNLNGEWQFAAAEAGEAPPVGEQLDERILVPYPVESELSGLERHEDRMWYRRTFTVPDNWAVGEGNGNRQERLKLNFEAVDWQAEVYVNGEQVATHKGGYDRFTADITDALDPERGAEQELIVGVYDPTDAAGGENPPMGKQRLEPGGIFYTASSGIWQSVWMEPVPENHAASLKITPDVAGEQVRLTVRNGAGGEGAEAAPVTASVHDGERKVGSATGTTGEELSVPVPDPHLWSPEDPHLYTLKVTVGEGGSADRVGSYVGMRSIAVEEVAGKQRMVLNGDPVFSMATLDQGFWPAGLHTAPTDEALRYDLEAHKSMGFNSVRKHIKVEPARWFYWADKLGLLVWQDMPSMNTVDPSPEAQAQYEHEMKEMIDQHYNSPSVVMWVTFNEGWGQYGGPKVPELAAKWDPTRLINGASGWHDTGNGDIADVHAYPGPGDPRPDDQRAGVVGEFGGLGLAVPGHSWPVRHSYVDVEDFTTEYLKLIDEVQRLVACNGASGAVYTQITDVEGELNGLLTYDREVLKADAGQLKAAHRALIESARAPGSLTCEEGGAAG